jgi:hypothetical protein
MKSILAFLFGAILAGAVVYFTVRPKTTPAFVAQGTPPTVEEQPASTVERVPLAEQPSPSRSVTPRPGPAAKKRLPERAAHPSLPVHRVESATTGAPAPEPVAQYTPPPAPAPTPAAAPVRQVESADPPPPERQPATVTIPAGTILVVRIDEALSTEKNAAGDSFRATLDAPLIVEGMAIAERGARAQGRIVDCDRSGKVKGLARMTLELTQLNTADGQRVKLQTNLFAREAPSTVKKDAAKVGIGAGIGAAIGAVAGGGKGAAIGAGAGGAAGAGDVLLTRGKPAELPAETRVSFRISEPITLTEKL